LLEWNRVYNTTVADKRYLRTKEDLERFFAGTEVLAPGIVPAPDWRPDNPGYEPDDGDQARQIVLAGVGRLLGPAAMP
jgi:S-adenosyl methyltransferase